MEDQEEKAKQNQFVIPGDFLCPESDHKPGTGTYTKHGNIYSSFCGKVDIKKTPVEAAELPLISVVSTKQRTLSVPIMGSRVICKVFSINERQAKVNIISVEGTVLQQPLSGVIRKSDVREMEKDSVVIFNSFRPGDLVRARVISLGEGNQYVLSTAENELGVFVGLSESGGTLEPVSWAEMQCSKTGLREKRKVAKVVDAVSV